MISLANLSLFVVGSVAAIVVPLIVHLLNRRRFDVIDWAAMQFLHLSQKTRRRLFLENVILLLIRMFLFFCFIAAVAFPVLDLSCISRLPGGQFLVRQAGQPDRDVLIIVDGSYSMDYKWQNKTAHDAARDWVSKFIGGLSNADRVAVLQAKQQPIRVIGSLTNRDDVRSKLNSMPKPRGGVDWAKTIQEGLRILQEGSNQQKEIIILTDGQRYGWADPKSIDNWELLVQGMPSGESLPRIWVVNVVPERPGDVPNWFVSSITSNRAVATLGREVKFKFDLEVARDDKAAGDESVIEKPKEIPLPPDKVKFEVDGRPAGEKEPPRSRESRVGMEFTQKFATTGSHLVSAMIGEDALPGDNRRDFAVEVVPSIPVLLVDGDGREASRFRGSDFLRFAIAPPNDPQPSFVLRSVPSSDFSLQLLMNPITRESGSIPRLLILSNVAELSDDQHKAIEDFLKRGGGVLVALGPRCIASAWNERAYREGQGWLPARLMEPKGDVNNIAKAPMIIADSIEQHSALSLFKSGDKGTLLSAYFPRYWKLDTEQSGSGSPIARLTTGDPLFVEKPFGKGRVILSAVPLDNGWRTNLTDLYDFVRLSHEILYYLAAARAADVNLEPRQPIVFRPNDGEAPGGITIDLPEGPRRRIEVTNWPMVYEDTRETGVYKLTTDSGRIQYYVVQPDTNESILTPCDDRDRQAVQSMFPPGRLVYENDPDKMVGALSKTQASFEMVWLLLSIVMVLLVAELVYARYLAKKSPPVAE